MADDIHEQLRTLKEELMKDCIKYEQNIAKYMAQKITEDITEYSKNVIKDFYDQYNPHDPSTHVDKFYYYRHGNFNKVPKRHYRKRGDMYVCGVYLERNLPDVYWGSHSEPEQVFNRVIFGGLHGMASLNIPNGIKNVPPKFEPSPYIRIREKFKEIQKNPTEYENYARKKAQQDTYKHISF